VRELAADTDPTRLETITDGEKKSCTTNCVASTEEDRIGSLNDRTNKPVFISNETTDDKEGFMASAI